MPTSASKVNENDGGYVAAETLDRIRSLPSTEVADRFGLPRDSRQYFGCPTCRSSDGFRVKSEQDSGGHCFVCGSNAADNIALVEMINGVEFSGSVEALADAFAIPMHYRDPDDLSAPSTNPERTPAEPGPTYADEERETIRWESRLGDAYDAFEPIWGALELEERGAAYLEGRGLPPDATLRQCVRSVDRQRWRRMMEAADDKRLRAAGFASYFLRPDWNPPPDKGPFEHALVFAYRNENGRIDTLRFREATDGAPVMGLCETSLEMGNARRGLAPHLPSGPFLADVSPGLARDRNLPLYVCEGEIDALSVVRAGRPAIGAPGASFFRTDWLDERYRGLEMVVLGDADHAGTQLAQCVGEAGAEAFGAKWYRRHFHAKRVDPSNPTGAGDANDFDGCSLRALLESLEARMGRREVA